MSAPVIVKHLGDTVCRVVDGVSAQCYRIPGMPCVILLPLLLLLLLSLLLLLLLLLLLPLYHGIYCYYYPNFLSFHLIPHL